MDRISVARLQSGDLKDGTSDPAPMSEMIQVDAVSFRLLQLRLDGLEGTNAVRLHD